MAMAFKKKRMAPIREGLTAHNQRRPRPSRHVLINAHHKQSILVFLRKEAAQTLMAMSSITAGSTVLVSLLVSSCISLNESGNCALYTERGSGR